MCTSLKSGPRYLRAGAHGVGVAAAVRLVDVSAHTDLCEGGELVSLLHELLVQPRVDALPDSSIRVPHCGVVASTDRALRPAVRCEVAIYGSRNYLMTCPSF